MPDFSANAAAAPGGVLAGARDLVSAFNHYPLQLADARLRREQADRAAKESDLRMQLQRAGGLESGLLQPQDNQDRGYFQDLAHGLTGAFMDTPAFETPEERIARQGQQSRGLTARYREAQIEQLGRSGGAWESPFSQARDVQMSLGNDPEPRMPQPPDGIALRNPTVERQYNDALADAQARHKAWEERQADRRGRVIKILDGAGDSTLVPGSLAPPRQQFYTPPDAMGNPRPPDATGVPMSAQPGVPDKNVEIVYKLLTLSQLGDPRIQAKLEAARLRNPEAVRQAELLYANAAAQSTHRQ